ARLPSCTRPTPADHPTVEHPVDPHLRQRDVQPGQLFADELTARLRQKPPAHFALEGFEPLFPACRRGATRSSTKRQQTVQRLAA
ncbi:MAG: hypothetical protein MZW92_39075, partial [Comamonadaceae bacterium]|nr:hypothetical protein [Comamonadaceae bacterium]